MMRNNVIWLIVGIVFGWLLCFTSGGEAHYDGVRTPHTFLKKSSYRRKQWSGQPRRLFTVKFNRKGSLNALHLSQEQKERRQAHYQKYLLRTAEIWNEWSHPRQEKTLEFWDTPQKRFTLQQRERFRNRRARAKMWHTFKAQFRKLWFATKCQNFKELLQLHALTALHIAFPEEKQTIACTLAKTALPPRKLLQPLQILRL